MMRRLWPPGAVVIAVVIAVVVIAVLRRRLLVVAVHGDSMAPVYTDGDTLLAVRPSESHRWRVGEDLVFARTGQQVVVPGDPPYLVKRVRAVPGGLVSGDTTDADGGPIPQGWLLLSGTNSSRSAPAFYSVPINAVIGKVVCRLRRDDQSFMASALLRTRQAPSGGDLGKWPAQAASGSGQQRRVREGPGRRRTR